MWIGAAYAITGVVVSPYLYFALAHGFPHLPPAWPTRYSTDLINFVIPTKVALLSGGPFAHLSYQLKAGLAEEGAYLGLLLVVVALFAVARWRTFLGKLLIITFAIICILSLGPTMQFRGHHLFPMPWRLVSRLPLLSNILPGRFMLFGWLVVALIVALWLSAAGRGRKAVAKWTVVGLSAVLLFPNLWAPLWKSPVQVPPFISQGTYRNYIVPGKNTLAIPFGSHGFSMLWQADAHMDFTLVGGYVACVIPAEFQRWPIVYTLLTKRWIPDWDRQLKGFLATHDVGTILVREGSSPFWNVLLSVLHARPVTVGGVVVYRPSPQVLDPYRNMAPDDSKRRILSNKCS